MYKKRLNYLANSFIYIIVISAFYQFYFLKVCKPYAGYHYWEVTFPLYSLITIIVLGTFILPYSIKLIRQKKIVRGLFLFLLGTPITYYGFLVVKWGLIGVLNEKFSLGFDGYPSFISGAWSTVVCVVVLLLSVGYKVYYIKGDR
jgi:hypothetical protein